jgi:histidyl-tRNA synthetase
MGEAGSLPAAGPQAEIAVVPLMDAAEADALMLAEMLRGAGHTVEIGYKGNAGKRLKRADKLGCRLAVILGEEELAQGFVTVKNLASGEQHRVSRDAVLAEIEHL